MSLKRGVDATEDYLSLARPGTGRILIEDSYCVERHIDEWNMANWLHREFGGDIVLLAEKNGVYQSKSADYRWNGRLWELKTIGSVKAVDAALRKAIGQIRMNPGGVILNFEKNRVSLSEAEKAVSARVKISSHFGLDVMILQTGKLIKVIRYT